jgi:hypothetical protein
VNVGHKSGLRNELQRLRRALEASIQHTLNSVDAWLSELESSDYPMVLYETDSREIQAKLGQRASELSQMATFLPAPSSLRLDPLLNRLASITAQIDQELRVCEEVYSELQEEITNASSRSALANLRITIKLKLPAAVQGRSELQCALDQAEDRLLVAELESLERGSRQHILQSWRVRGVSTLQTFREYGVDPPTARKLVIDRNNGVIDLDGLLDSLIEIARRTKQRDSGCLQRLLNLFRGHSGSLQTGRVICEKCVNLDDVAGSNPQYGLGLGPVITIGDSFGSSL